MDPRTQDPKEYPITEHPKEDHINKIHRKNPITEDPKGYLITEDLNKDPTNEGPKKTLSLITQNSTLSLTTYHR